MPRRRILVPTDGSACSERAAERAVALAKVEGSSVGFLFVMDTLRNHPEGLTKEAREAMSDEGERTLAHGRRLAADAGVEADGELVEGDPADEILRRAKDVDLIILGTHGTRRWNRLAFGSVTQAVLRRAARPLLIVHCADAPTAV